MTAITDKKVRDKIIKGDKTKTKKDFRIDQTNYIRAENSKEHKTGSIDTNKRKTHSKGRNNP